MVTVICKVSLFLLLVVVALRPIVAETYGDSGTELRFSGIADLPPLVTLGFDLVILLAACGWLLARAMGPAPAYRRCGIEGGAILVAIAGVVSCMAADNKRLAINATLDWLMLPVVTIVLANLLRRRWHIRLALCVILSIAAVQAVQCFDQVLVTNKDTRERFLQNREQFWADRGLPLDSPTVTLFEQRLKAGEATGYLAHSNVTGGYLILCGLTAVAFGVARWRGSAQPFRKGFAVAALLIGGGLLAAAVTTQSKGALVAAGVGGLVWILAHRLRGLIDRHRRRLWIGGWCAVGIVVLAIVGYGSASGGLPHPSLDFRWGYWTASARMIGDRPWTGVGRENFGEHYLAYKSIKHPEEVSNPHNFLVQAGADWGIAGLIGMVWMMVGASRVVTRPIAKPVSVDTNADPPGRPMLWAVTLMAAVFLVRIPLLGSDNSAYVLISTLIPFMVMAIVFAILAMETNTTHVFMNDPLPGLTLGINCALLAFLVQDTINFALIVPGAATTFFALLGVGIALRAPEKESTHPPRASGWIAFAIAAVLLMICAGKFVWPVADSLAWRVRAAQQTYPQPNEPPNRQYVYRCLAAASVGDPFDPTPAVELAGWLQSAAHLLPDETVALAEAVNWMHEAIRRNPRSTSLHRQLSALHQRLAERSDPPAHLRAAVAAERRVIELYPESPDTHVNLGDRLASLAAAVGDAAAFDEAAEHYQTALDLDDSRPEWETIRRFTAAKRAEIETRREGTMKAVNALRISGRDNQNPSRDREGAVDDDR